MGKLDGNIKDKENLLAAIKEQQVAMQDDLLSLMKNQYQSKVLELTNAITTLENEKADHMSRQGGVMSQQQRKKIEETHLQK